MADQRTYGYRELAGRIEEELGVRPSLSALRAAATAERRAATTHSRPRVTAGMPQPLPRGHRTAPALFPAQQVEQWLATHPRRRWKSAVATYRSALQDTSLSTEQAVAVGREHGLSWSQITEGLREVRRDTRVRAAIYKAYRHLG